MRGVLRAALVVTSLLTSGCDSVLGFDHPTIRDAGGTGSDGGAGTDAAIPLTIPGFTSIGPDGVGSGFRVLDPRFEAVDPVCSQGSNKLCIVGAFTSGGFPP